MLFILKSRIEKFKGRPITVYKKKKIVKYLLMAGVDCCTGQKDAQI